jgi:hypothetical protein
MAEKAFPVNLQFETDKFLDDIVLRQSGGGSILVQCKTHPSLSSDSALAGTIDQLIAKPFAEQSTTRPCAPPAARRQSSAARNLARPTPSERGRMPPPIAPDAHVARQQEVASQAVGGSTHKRLCLVVEIGRRQPCARGSERLGATGGNAVFVSDPDYRPSLALQRRPGRVESDRRIGFDFHQHLPLQIRSAFTSPA